MKTYRSSAFNWAIIALGISLVLTIFFSIIDKEFTSRIHILNFEDGTFIKIPILSIWYLPITATLLTCGIRFLFFLINDRKRYFSSSYFGDWRGFLSSIIRITILLICVGMGKSIFYSDHGIFEIIVIGFLYWIGILFFLIILSGTTIFFLALYERIHDILKTPAFKGKAA